MKKVPVKQYKDLRAGKTYVFRSFGKKGYTNTTGKLVFVRTRWKDKRDEEGKVIGRELYADTVRYEPFDKYYDWKGEKLKVYYTQVGCGLFQIFRHAG